MKKIAEMIFTPSAKMPFGPDISLPFAASLGAFLNLPGKLAQCLVAVSLNRSNGPTGYHERLAILVTNSNRMNLAKVCTGAKSRLPRLGFLVIKYDAQNVPPLTIEDFRCVNRRRRHITRVESDTGGNRYDKLAQRTIPQGHLLERNSEKTLLPIGIPSLLVPLSTQRGNRGPVFNILVGQGLNGLAMQLKLPLEGLLKVIGADPLPIVEMIVFFGNSHCFVPTASGFLAEFTEHHVFSSRGTENDVSGLEHLLYPFPLRFNVLANGLGGHSSGRRYKITATPNLLLPEGWMSGGNGATRCSLDLAGKISRTETGRGRQRKMNMIGHYFQSNKSATHTFEVLDN